jgi:hypothetical protein
MGTGNTKVCVLPRRASRMAAIAGAAVLTLLCGLAAPTPARALKSSIQSKSFGLPEGGGIVHVFGNLQNDDPTSFVVLTEVHVFNGPAEVPVTGGLLSNIATASPNPSGFITLEPDTPAGNPNSFFPSPAGGELLTFTWKTPATATLQVSGYTYVGTPPVTPPASDRLGTFTFQVGVTGPEPSALALLAIAGGPAVAAILALRRAAGRQDACPATGRYATISPPTPAHPEPPARMNGG